MQAKSDGAEKQLNFLDYPMHYWHGSETRPAYIKLHSRMREGYLRISNRAKQPEKSLLENEVKKLRKKLNEIEKILQS